MAVAVAADALIAVLICRNLDVVLGNGIGFLNGTELGVNEQTELIGCGLVDQRVADRAVVRLRSIALNPELDPRKRVCAVLTETEVLRIRFETFDDGLEVCLLVGGELVERILQIAGVFILREHIKEVLADDLGVDVHEQTVFTFRNEVPAVGEGLGAGAVVLEDLVQGLQRQIALPRIRGGAVCLCPLERYIRIEDAGLDHLALDLVAVLDQGDREGALILHGVGGQLIEDLVVLRLLPFEVERVVRIDRLQILDEQRESGLTAAGVAHAVEGRAVGFFDRLFAEILKGHTLCFFDDFLYFGFRTGLSLVGAAARNKAKNHHESQHDSNKFFHDFPPDKYGCGF